MHAGTPPGPDAGGERHRRESELFDAACDLEPGEQRELLERECAGEPSLRRRLEELLELDRAPQLAIEPRDLPWFPGGGPAATPERIGPYRILSELGRGGMGIVYRAEQESPRREVALKVIGSGLFGPDLLQRFEREARVLGRLNHPGIAQIHEAAVADTPQGPRPYLAMELVVGEPLVTYCEQRACSLRQRLELLALVCDAIEHAHHRGVIHRDLKPANILVQADGRPKVLDFGVARVVDLDPSSGSRHTRAGDLIGTLAYMSPEQLAGRPEDVDLRSDVHALGVIAFELLAGRLPFDLAGRSLPECTRILVEREPARLSALRRDLRGDVSTIVAKALERDWERRYASAGALAGDIRRFLAHEPILARPASGIYQARKFARRNRGLTAGLLLTAAALVAGTLVALRQARQADRARALAEDRGAAALRASRRATLLAASMASDIYDLHTCERLLESIEPAERTWEWRCIANRIDTSAARLRPGEPVRAAGFLPGDEALILVTASGEVQRWSPDGLERQGSTRLEDALSGPAALSRDGRFLAGIFGADGAQAEVGLWELDTGRRAARAAAQETATALAVAPDGSRVAYAGAQSWLWEPASGRAPVAFHRGLYGHLAFASRSDSFVLSTNHPGVGRVQAFDAANGQATASRVDVSGNRVYGVAMSPDGALIAAGTAEKRVELVDARTGQRLAALLGHRDLVSRVAFSSDGTRLASASNDGTVRTWDLARRAQVSALSRLPSVARDVLFDDSGARVLALSGDEAVLWKLDHESQGVLARMPSYAYGVAFLGQGARLVALSFDSSLRMHDSHSGELLWRMDHPGNGKALCAARDAPLFASGHSSQVLVRDADSGTLLRTLGCGGTVIGLSLSADGARLAVRTVSHALLFDPRSGLELWRRPMVYGSEIGCAALSPDGRRMASSEGQGVLLLWDLERGGEPLAVRAHSGVIEALAFSWDGALLASGGADHAVRLWDGRSGAPLWTADGHTDRVYALSFAPDGSRLASGSNDATIRLWDVARGEEVGLLDKHSDYVFSLCFSPDGSMLASASGDFDVRVWDTVARHGRAREGARRRALRIETLERVRRLARELATPAEVAAALRASAELDDEQREAAVQALLLCQAPRPSGL